MTLSTMSESELKTMKENLMILCNLTRNLIESLSFIDSDELNEEIAEDILEREIPDMFELSDRYPYNDMSSVYEICENIINILDSNDISDDFLDELTDCINTNDSYALEYLVDHLDEYGADAYV